MYRFSDKELNLEGIVGNPLNMLCQGAYDLHLVFDGSNIKRFTIMGVVRLYEAGKLLASWEDEGWNTVAYQRLLNAVPIAWRIVEPAILEITFENGVAMHIIDDSDQYEAVVIEFTDRPTLIVV